MLTITKEDQMLGCTMAAEHKTNHTLHLLLTLVTFGVWSWVWLFVASGNIKKRNKIKAEHGLETENNVPQLILVISFILIVLVPVLTAMAPKAKADSLPGDVVTQVIFPT